MQKFFKYKFGYINVDNENIYLTNSGNWAECKRLQEKSLKTDIRTISKQLKISSLIFTAALFVFGNIIFSIQSGSFKVLPAIISTLALFGLYKVFMRDLGSQYLIPIANIISLKNRNQDLVIDFKDYKGQTLTKSLTEVENFEWESIEQLKNSINQDVNEVSTNNRN